MIKSIFSVCENNVIAFVELGHAANLQPYIEPAAAMTFARNVFAHVTAADTGMDVSINAYTTGDLATSCSLMTDPRTAALYNFTNTTVPALATPVILEWDYNLWYDTGHDAAQVAAQGWDTHGQRVWQRQRVLHVLRVPFLLVELERVSIPEPHSVRSEEHTSELQSPQ